MGSKIFLLLGLSVAIALLISSEVAARDLAETTTKPEGYHGGGYNNGGGYHNGGGGGYNNGGGYHNGGGGYNNGGGYHNGGGGGYNNGGGYHHGGGHGGGCYHYCHGRCCSAAEEAALKATEVKPQN